MEACGPAARAALGLGGVTTAPRPLCAGRTLSYLHGARQDNELAPGHLGPGPLGSVPHLAIAPKV